MSNTALIYGDACSAPQAGAWDGKVVISPYGATGCTAIKLATTAQEAAALTKR